jgi:signal transduction histidine kinase
MNLWKPPGYEILRAMSAVSMSAAAAAEHPARSGLVGVGGRRGFVRYLGGVALLVGLYYGSARVGFALAFAGPVGAVAWLPVGVAAAFLAVFGLAFWPGALIADVLVNHEIALPAAGALGQTVANVLEVLVIAWLVRRRWRESAPAGMSEVGWLVVAIAVGTALSAILGPLSLWLGGVVSPGSLPEVMRTWWLGDFCGALVVVPLVLVWRRFPPIRVDRRLIEGAVLVAAVGGLSIAASGVGDPLTYIVFPLLVWTVFRFGMRGATVAVLVTVGATVVTETRMNGPFSSDSFAHSVLSTQLFIVVAMLSALFFAAVVQEHRALQNELAFSRAKAIHAAELERSRIERDLHDGAQQRLLALAIRLGLAADRQTMSPGEARAFFRAANRELEIAIDELRELSHGTHPAVLQELGLGGAIRSLALRSVIPVIVSDLPTLRLDEAAEAAAYFVVVEAVANVHKHAHATAVQLDAHYAMPWLYVTVRDNGRGGAQETPGSGLAGLRRRVESLAGELAVESGGNGTTVAAKLPAFPT